MTRYLTIDGGTTNTRISLVVDRKKTDTVKLSIGAGKSKENKNLYICEIKNGIEEILSRNALHDEDITSIIASGMITSEYGLCNLPHINTPAGLNELHENLHKASIPEISPIPFVFVRGVKMQGDDFSCTDIMRGEETEIMGIINPEYKDCVYVLPGSHSKIIRTDDNGCIVSFDTMLTGEMTFVLSQNTILKDAVDLSCESFDEDFLLEGYEYAKIYGLNKALFKVRILKNIFECSALQTYSFFLGAVLQGEIECIINSGAKTVVLAGKAQLKEPMVHILKHRSVLDVCVVSDNEVDNSTSLGAVRIYENRF